LEKTFGIGLMFTNIIATNTGFAGDIFIDANLFEKVIDEIARTTGDNTKS